MKLSRHALSLFTVLAVTMGTGLGDHSEARAESAAAASVEARPDRPGAVFDHIMINPDQPGDIIPCIRVLRQYYQRSRHDSSLQIELRLIYLSNGMTIEKFFVVPLAEFTLTEHHTQPKQADWKLVDTVIDIADAPVDEGTSVQGTATLIDGGAATQTTSFSFAR